jgi:hypothetical protein
MNPKNNFINNLTTNYSKIGLPNLSQNKTTAPASKFPMSTFENTAATSPAVPKPVTPTVTNKPSVQLPPSGQQFVNNLVSQNTTQPQVQNQQTPTQTPVEKPKTAYDKYIESLSSPENTKLLSKKTEAEQRLADIQSRNEKQYVDTVSGREKILDTSGGLKRGAEESAALFGRRATAESAYGAVEEGSAARSALVAQNAYNDAIGAGKSAFEAQRDADKAVQDQTNYEREQKLAEDKFEEDKRQFGEQMALERYKATAPKPLTAAQEAKQIADQEKEVAAQQSASQSIGLVNNLLSGERFKSISGGIQTGSIPFLGDRTAVNEYDQLQGLMKLGIRGLLKGQGAVSDYEGKVLGQAASALSRLTDEKSFEQGLKTVRGVLKTNNGQVTPVLVTNPQTGEQVEAELSGSEIYQLTSEGNTITYK